MMLSPTVTMALPGPSTTSLSPRRRVTLSPDSSLVTLPPSTSTSGVRPKSGPLEVIVTGTGISRPSSSTAERAGAAGAAGSADGAGCRCARRSTGRRSARRMQQAQKRRSFTRERIPLGGGRGSVVNALHPGRLARPIQALIQGGERDGDPAVSGGDPQLELRARDEILCWRPGSAADRELEPRERAGRGLPGRRGPPGGAGAAGERGPPPQRRALRGPGAADQGDPGLRRPLGAE